MDGQIIQHDHVAWPQGRAQHLVKVGGEYGPVHGSVHAQERPEAVGGEGGNERHVRAAVQGHGLVQAAARRGAAAAAAIGQIRAGFVHEYQTRHIFLRKGFQRQPAQAHDAGRVAFGGVDAFFLRPQPRASVARQVVLRLRAGPPTAANSVRSSSSVASGWATKQARSCA